MIAFVLRSRGQDRSKRLVCTSGFCLQRLLIVPGGSFFIDTNSGAQQFYVEFQAASMVQVTLSRLIANAGEFEEVEHIHRAATFPGAPLSHYDYRPRNLLKRPVTPNVDSSKPRKRTLHGRADAEAAALANYDKHAASSALWLSRDEYRDALRAAASLIEPVELRGAGAA
jgi:hypothetical protein